MQVLDDIDLQERTPKRPDVLFNIALSTVLLGAFFGALTSWLNAWISPQYFQEAMGWTLKEARPASLIQGGLAGLAYGFAFAGYFTIVCGWATRFRCSFPFAFRQMLKITFFILLSWAAGGLAGSAFYRPAAEEASLHSSYSEILNFAVSSDRHSRWVAGAILGQKAGFLLAAAFCPIVVWRAWRRRPVK